MRKRFLIMLSIVALLLSIMFVPGGQAAPPTTARYGMQKSAAVETSTALVLPANTWVYGIEMFADAANSFMGIYDVATLAGATSSTVSDEIGEATQYDTQTKMYTKPVLFTNGVTVVMSTGVGFILHGPQP